MAGHDFVVTLMICWAITPIGHLAIGLIGESRLVPLDSWNGRQFWSFFPGDVFLGVTAAFLLVAAGNLPSEQRFYNATWFHIVVLVVVAAVAIFMTYGEWKSGAYGTRAMYSPTKIYHNGVLYAGFGYVIVSTFIALVGAVELKSLIVPALFFVVWMGMLVVDNSIAPEPDERAQNAHIEDWSPIWEH